MKELLEGAGVGRVEYVDYGSDVIDDIPRLADILRLRITEILASSGASQIDVVAHSMGGLVTRAYMTNMHPSASDPTKQYHGEIRRLALVGTPNYGLKLADYSEFCELVLCTEMEGRQAEQMRYGSNFLWVLHNKWEEMTLQHPEVLAGLLVIAGTGGLGQFDGLVTIPGATLVSRRADTRYVPYIHSSAVPFFLRELTEPTAVPLVDVGSVTTCVAGSEDNDPYCDDWGDHHKTVRFIVPFLAAGAAPPQDEVWHPGETIDEGLVLMHLVDSQGDPISREATSKVSIQFTPALCPTCWSPHPNEDSSTFTAAGVNENTYSLIVKAQGYLPATVNKSEADGATLDGVVVLGGRPTVVGEVTLNYVDLIETQVSEPPPNGTPRQRVRVRDTVRNVGTGTASPSKTLYYLSLNGVSLDVQLEASTSSFPAMRLVPALAPGEESTGETLVKVPELLLGQNRSFYLLVCANGTGTVEELYPTNNCRSSQRTIRVR